MAEATDFLCISYTQLFLIPAVFTIVIAATRTYRALTSYGSAPLSSKYDISSTLYVRCSLSYPSPSGPPSFNIPKSSRLVSSAKDSSIVHIPGNRLEVSVHKAYEEYPMSTLNDKPPRELGSDDNV